jgi:uncharacterized caspase-like protein
MKRSLHVGINEFPGLPSSNLQGCVNDAHDLANLLTHAYGFNQVKVMLNADASRRGILGGLAWLCDGAIDGDELVFSYSCHGTQIDDRDGDEPDRLDEAICPADLSYANWDKTLIVDDELRKLFSALPVGANLTVIGDACHSGSQTRDVLAPPAPRPRARFLGPRLRRAGGYCRRPRLLSGAEQNWLMLSGCRDDETSADAYIDGRYNGAMTWALLRAAREIPSRSWSDGHEAMRQALAGANYEQHPVLSGPAEMLARPLFGGIAA